MASTHFDRGVVIPALITPFKNDGSLNLKALEQLVALLINEGCKAFYVSGSTGEAFLQTPQERKEVIACVCNACKGKAHVIFQTGAISTDQAVDMAKFATEQGVQELSSLPPFYYKFSGLEIEAYYREIMETTGKPMIIYNIPFLTGVSMTQACPQLLKHPQVSGIKHTTSDFFELRKLQTEYPNLTLFSGFDEMALAGLSMGANGLIGSTYNYQADTFFKIVNAFQSGNIQEALFFQDQANKTIKTILSVGLYNSVRYLVTKKYGIDVGVSRKPFAPLSDEAKQILDQLEI